MLTFQEYKKLQEAVEPTEQEINRWVSNITSDCYRRLMNILWKINDPALHETAKKTILQDLQAVGWEIEEKDIESRSPRHV
jgi:hypothetical protein